VVDSRHVRALKGDPNGRRPADRGYDHDKCRAVVREPGITPVIARRGTEHGSGLGKLRSVVEQSFALLHRFRRLRIRWEIRDDIHESLLELGCALIWWRHPEPDSATGSPAGCGRLVPV
jgi:transposase